MNQLRDAVKALFGAIDARDVCVFGGIALLTAGAGAIYPAAGLLVCGALFLLLGIFGVPKWR